MILKISTATKQTIDDLVTLFSEYQSFYGAKPDAKLINLCLIKSPFSIC